MRLDYDESTGEYTRIYLSLNTLENHNLVNIDSSIRSQLEKETFDSGKSGMVYFSSKTVKFEIVEIDV